MQGVEHKEESYYLGMALCYLPGSFLSLLSFSLIIAPLSSQSELNFSTFSGTSSEQKDVCHSSAIIITYSPWPFTSSSIKQGKRASVTQVYKN